MKVGVNIVNPAIRTQSVEALARQHGLDRDQTNQVRFAMTPPALRHLPDHPARGHKSLGRIQQINKRRRFKARPALSR